ncbi:MFS transporter [Amycolatopsis jiangsuensis]|uniref:MFS family permease n=1 Tax=Amycolatopsis jiangsuensis TaxID=1181879 RepID=A0A840IXY0_9PSEU|nr:MFS transporter [Amycolatopsis jiangsuensis]MBB4685734.1 MFS family permease [Amycolatopsis jiangsuensis]
MSTPPLTTETHPRTGALATAILGTVILVLNLLESMLVPALPLIQAGVGASTASITWVFTGLLLSGAVSTPLIGRLAELHNKKTVFFVVWGVVVAGVLLSALATSIVPLAIGQVLQGAGLGFAPLAIGLVRETQSAEKAKTSTGLLIGMSALGSVAGLLLSGPLLTVLSYHWLYWLPLAALVLLGIVAVPVFPATPAGGEGRIDWVGAVLLSAGLFAVLIALTEAPAWGWSSAQFLLLAALGVVLLAAFTTAELKMEQPLVDLRAGGKAVIITCVVAFAVGWATYAVYVALPTIVAAPPSVGYGLGGTPTTAGLLLLPLGVLGAVSAALTGRLERIFGSKTLMILSCLPVVASSAILFLARHDAAVLALASGLAGLGIGIGLTQAMNIVSSSVPVERLASASGFLLVLRQVGGTLGAQVSGSVLAGGLIEGTPLPTWSSFGAIFWISTVVGLGAIATSLALPRRLAGAAVTS